MGRAEEAVGDYLDLALQRYGHTALLPKILDLRENLSAYDACYVALAQQLNAQLLTTDRRLARAVAADPRLRVVLAGHA
jgi:predicted nucleic acid-binding protein